LAFEQLPKGSPLANKYGNTEPVMMANLLSTTRRMASYGFADCWKIKAAISGPVQDTGACTAMMETSFPYYH